MDILSDKEVKIRKPRRCFGCNRKFEIGAKMQRQVSVDGGHIGAVYDCPTCNTLMKDFTDHFRDESCFDDEFYQCCVTEAINETHEFTGTTPEEFLEFLKRAPN